MRWRNRDLHGWQRRFAVLPVTVADETVWLEWFWRRFAGDCIEISFGDQHPFLTRQTQENLMTDTHSIERTSPKGGPFIGRCVHCGKDGLTWSNMEEACANPAGTSQEEDLMAALEAPND